MAGESEKTKAYIAFVKKYYQNLNQGMLIDYIKELDREFGGPPIDFSVEIELDDDSKFQLLQVAKDQKWSDILKIIQAPVPRAVPTAVTTTTTTTTTTQQHILDLAGAQPDDRYLLTRLMDTGLTFAGGEVNALANRKLKEISPWLETVIYNVAMISGRTAAAELSAQLTGILADCSAKGSKFAAKFTSSFIIDYAVGSMLANVVRAAIIGKMGTASHAFVAEQAIKFLKALYQNGASAAVIQAAFNTFQPFWNLGFFEQKHLEYTILRPGMKIAAWTNKDVNNIMAILDTPNAIYKEAKTTLIDTVIDPIAATLYNETTKTFLVDYWSFIGKELGHEMTEQLAQEHIVGKVAPALNAMIDEMIPTDRVTMHELNTLIDLTDMNTEHQRVITEAREGLQNRFLGMIQEQLLSEGSPPAITAANTEPATHLTTTTTTTNHPESTYQGLVGYANVHLIEALENALHQQNINLPQGLLQRIMVGERMSKQELDRYAKEGGYLAETAAALTLAAKNKFNNLTNFLGVTWDPVEQADIFFEDVMSYLDSDLNEEAALANLKERLEKFKKFPVVMSNINKLFLKEEGFHTLIQELSIKQKNGPFSTNQSARAADMIEMFLEMGIKVDVVSPQGISPLHLIVTQLAHRNEALAAELLERCLKYGADPSIGDKLGKHNCLLLAAFHGHKQIVERLLQDPKIRDSLIHDKNLNGHNALHRALQNGHTDIAKMLIQAGIDLAVKDTNGLTAFDLMGAELIGLKHDDEFKAIMDKRLLAQLEQLKDVDKASELGLSDHAFNELMIMIHLGGDPQLLQAFDQEQIQAGHKPFIVKLIEGGQLNFAQVLVHNHQLPLQVFQAETSFEDAFDLITKCMTHRNADLFIYLVQQLESQHPEWIERLMKHQNADQQNLILLATKADNPKIIKFCIEKGANIDYQDAVGNTPLMNALNKNNYQAALELLKLGANPLLNNHANQSAINAWALYYHSLPACTRAEGYTKLKEQMDKYNDVTFLLEHCATPSATPQMMLVIANQVLKYNQDDPNKQIEQLKQLIDMCPELLTCTDQKGKTLLHRAWHHYHKGPEVIHWLIHDQKMDPLATNNRGYAFYDYWMSKLNVGVSHRQKRSEITQTLTKAAKEQQYVSKEQQLFQEAPADIDEAIDKAIIILKSSDYNIDEQKRLLTKLLDEYPDLLNKQHEDTGKTLLHYAWEAYNSADKVKIIHWLVKERGAHTNIPDHQGISFNDHWMKRSNVGFTPFGEAPKLRKEITALIQKALLETSPTGPTMTTTTVQTDKPVQEQAANNSQKPAPQRALTSALDRNRQRQEKLGESGGGGPAQGPTSDNAPEPPQATNKDDQKPSSSKMQKKT